MSEVHSTESNLFVAQDFPRSDWIVNFRLCCKWQHSDIIVSQFFLVIQHTRLIGGQDYVKEGCRPEEISEVWRIFLVPENCWDSLLLSIFY
ncbi:hypothetical protein CIK84_06345 [Glutamicibacter arilaitensis]|uniref:Uncharacterized protein n=1 Tax=Glutamicibacter arilaitensis TaxID=256701 RepID=A0A2N7S4Y2_9MICC|nr:hypothetical protein CIK84_06345 [Glutamicibacter arilaitensis]